MKKRLPPLNALRAFEAAGRLQSLTDAARELSVTPAAIGHQVKALEQYFGRSLVERRYRAIALTDAGRSLLPGLSEGFDRLNDAVEAFTAFEERRALLVTCATSFASRWLVPRLDRFYELHPEIDVRLDATQRVVDLRREEVDIGIRFGTGDWDGLEADYLIEEEMIPVGSPDLLALKPVARPADLAGHTLLHIDDGPGPAPVDWARWLAAAGVDGIDASRGPSFSMESMAIQAAIDGQGIALVSDVLAADEIAAGRLLRLFDLGLKSGIGLAYYLVYPSSRARSPRVAAFRQWLIAEIESLRQA